MATAFICEECPRPLECVVCGSTFQYTKAGPGRLPRFCSLGCKQKQLSRQHSQYRSEGRRYGKPGYAAAWYASKQGAPFTCAAPNCGKVFTSRQRAAKYCCTACVASVMSAIQTERHGRPKLTCEKCGELFKPSRLNRKQKENGYVQRRCSYECAGKPARVAPNRRKRSDALKSGGYWKPVNPFVVFDRDGWKCHLCGIKTPKHLRGTTDNRAPELDHIVPIAADGEHTYQNTACACRKCNRMKGRKPLGQLLLFG